MKLEFFSHDTESGVGVSSVTGRGWKRNSEAALPSQGGSAASGLDSGKTKQARTIGGTVRVSGHVATPTSGVGTSSLEGGANVKSEVTI